MTYLDTHVAVWLYSGLVDLLSEPAQRRIEAEDDLLVSPAVLLELQYLYEIKRTKQPAEVIAGALRQEIGLGICERPFPEVARQALSLAWVRDPFDRLIVAQAELMDAALVTKDERIRRHFRRAVW